MRQAGGGNVWRAARRLAIASATLLLVVADNAPAEPAESLPAEPMLRIDAQAHGAMINRIATDRAERFAITASDDKTVRVWSLPGGQLQRVLRLPSDQGHSGKAFAAALAPDGATVAVGGWTGVGGNHNIFLFDRTSGALTKRIDGLPEVVLHLAYSKDGQLLVATLGGANGFRVFDAARDFRALPSDAQYTDASYWADFAGDRRLVTASYDGRVRLYAPGRYDNPLKSIRDSVVSRPFSAVFSPDGMRVAVGDHEKAGVVVLSGRDLARLYVPDVTGITGGTVESVGWSADGSYLYAGGTTTLNVVRRWSDGGRGSSVDISGFSNTLIELVPRSDGGMLFAATNRFGLIDQTGNVARLQDIVALDWRGGSAVLRVSKDGKILQMDAINPDRTIRFSLPQRLVAIDAAPDTSLAAPITQARGIPVADWRHSTHPNLNGKRLNLEKYEISRSLAIVPGTNQFILGADWSVRLFDASGKELWPKNVSTPEVAWAVNVTPDRRLVVAALGDGTIRWLRLSDGKEILALFIHPDGQRWVAWTPQGYYDASTGADDLIGWHVNRGYDNAPDFFPASQFRDQYYRPDVVARVLDTLDPEVAAREADAAAGRKTAKAAPVASLLTPVVQIKDPADGGTADRPELALTYSVRMPTKDPFLRVEALIDQTKVQATDKELLTEGSTRVGKLELKLPRRDAKVSVIAYNVNGASEPASIRLLWRGPGVEAKPTLYVVAIGLSHYKNGDRDKELNLRYAAKDAEDFVAAVKRQGGGLYADIVTHAPGGSLRDEAATREAILDEFDWIKHAVTSSDVAMVFISGHGIKTPDQHYRLLPYDYDPERKERTTITDVELQQYLANIGGKTLFFFDTCYSAGVLGKALGFHPDVDKFANELRAAENGVVVFASSTGNQLSHEDDAWRNGAFTKALVEGLGGIAARPQMHAISISDLEGYVARRVKELTKGDQTPMTAKPKTVEDFWIAAVRQ
jgi:WD40 repeat protein